MSMDMDETYARQLQEEENRRGPLVPTRNHTHNTHKPTQQSQSQPQRPSQSNIKEPDKMLSSPSPFLSFLFRRADNKPSATSPPPDPAIPSIGTPPIPTIPTTPSPPFSHIIPSTSSQNLLCAICSRAISGRYTVLGQLQQPCHMECFRCFACHDVITGEYITRSNTQPTEWYHQSCYDILFTTHCDVCGMVIQGRYACPGYFTDEQKYCLTPCAQSSRECFCCHRKEPLSSFYSNGGTSSGMITVPHTSGTPSTGRRGHSEPFPTLPDGRLLCWKCIDYVIVDSTEAEPLYQEAVDFMEHVLHLPIPKGMREVPVLAVDLYSLNDQLQVMASATVHSTCAHSESGHDVTIVGDHTVPAAALTTTSSLTRGLTLTEVSEVRHISRNGSRSGGSGWLDGIRDRQYTSSSMQLQRQASVTAVLVLCGLPRDLTASILAHEAMHVWCKLRSPPLLSLPPVVEEGICQLVAYEYLDKGPGCKRSGSDSDGMSTWADKLRLYFKFQIQSDPSPVYGDGFRQAAAAAAALGFEVMLEHVTASEQFPLIT